MNTEKVSVNVNVVDLGKIELLIEKGVYTNKTDFMIKAIANELNKNEAFIQTTVTELDTDVHVQIGRVTYNAEKLTKLRASKMCQKLYVIGRLTIEDDVTLDMARATLLSIRVFGPSKMPAELRDYYGL